MLLNSRSHISELATEAGVIFVHVVPPFVERLKPCPLVATYTLPAPTAPVINSCAVTRNIIGCTTGDITDPVYSAPSVTVSDALTGLDRTGNWFNGSR